MEENLETNKLIMNSNNNNSISSIVNHLQEKLIQPAISSMASNWKNTQQQQQQQPYISSPEAFTTKEDRFNRILGDDLTRHQSHQEPIASNIGNDINNNGSSSSTSSTSNNMFSDFILQYVNLNLVRKMIAQNQIELIFICVIITYLIYYFSQISRVSRQITIDFLLKKI